MRAGIISPGRAVRLDDQGPHQSELRLQHQIGANQIGRTEFDRSHDRLSVFLHDLTGIPVIIDRAAGPHGAVGLKPTLMPLAFVTSNATSCGCRPTCWEIFMHTCPMFGLGAFDRGLIVTSAMIWAFFGTGQHVRGQQVRDLLLEGRDRPSSTAWASCCLVRVRDGCAIAVEDPDVELARCCRCRRSPGSCPKLALRCHHPRTTTDTLQGWSTSRGRSLNGLPYLNEKSLLNGVFLESLGKSLIKVTLIQSPAAARRISGSTRTPSLSFPDYRDRTRGRRSPRSGSE